MQKLTINLYQFHLESQYPQIHDTAILTWLKECILKDSQDVFVWESLESQAYVHEKTSQRKLKYVRTVAKNSTQ